MENVMVNTDSILRWLAEVSDPEIPVFRAWLRSFWKTGEERWGPAPTA